MDSLTAGTLSVTNIAKCILELVSNSLNANATSIAIRIQAENRKIQIIDNGTGISKQKLKTLAEYNNQIPYNYCNVQDVCNLKKQTILNIRKLADALLIISRHCNSSKTYMKVFKVYHNPKIVKIQRRPSHGTTVSIHGFHELSLNKWNLPVMYHLIANVAIANPQISISIRDDQEQKVIMMITKPHDPKDIFKLLYNKEVILHNTWYIQNVEEFDVKFCAYVGLSDAKSNTIQRVFLNNKVVHCPLILKVTSAIFIDTFSCFAKIHCGQTLNRKTVFVLFFITSTDYIFTMEHGKKTLILPSIQTLIQNIRKEILNIFAKNITPLFDNIPGYVKKHKNATCNYTKNLNTVKLLKNVSIPRLSLSQKSRRQLTIYNVKRKVTKLKISQTRKSNDNISIVNSIDRLQISNFNTEEKLYQDSDNTTLLTASKIIDITPISQDDNANKKLTILSPYEWSDWSYSGKKSWSIKKIQTICGRNHFENNFMEVYKRFDFLPERLHKQLRGNSKLTKIDILKELGENNSSMKLKLGLKNTLIHQEFDIRPCRVVQPFREFRLKKEFLQFLKILGQMNNELIVGLINRNDIKILLLMDQHAVHERIRYENLLHKYKSQTSYLLSIKLKDPIAIELSVDECNLLILNKVTLKKFGISFNIINDNTVIVYTVPECLQRNKYYEFKLKLNVEALVNEILQSLTTYKYYGCNNLPPTIHNAIAMEACYGAIKFGDPLTLKECKWLLKSLNKTKVPTRCAHGRPSIIPLLELTELERRRKITKVCCKSYSLIKLRNMLQHLDV